MTANCISHRFEDDIPLLVDHFIKHACDDFQKTIRGISSDFISSLESYSWPGNVRELQNILKRGFALGNWDEIIDELFRYAPASTPSSGQSVGAMGRSASVSSLSGLDYRTLNLDDISLKDITRAAQGRVEREVISFVLEKTGWNRSKASRILKISYKALLYKIKDLNIIIPH